MKKKEEFILKRQDYGAFSYFPDLLLEYFERVNEDIAHLNPKFKFQDLRLAAKSVTVGIRATMWTNVLKTFVIPLKGGGRKVIEVKALYPTLEIPFSDKPYTITSKCKTIPPSEIKWHNLEPDKAYETIEGVEEVRDNSLELELMELKEKFEELEEENKRLERAISKNERDSS